MMTSKPSHSYLYSEFEANLGDLDSKTEQQPKKPRIKTKVLGVIEHAYVPSPWKAGAGGFRPA